ncbi:MAG: MIT C-terminal domain-containing protein [Thiobacillus sp.]|uniref:dynamin family protein n=1 Tax=Thiobacillus sp. TaxID=924 RepID=UPI002894DE4B|nr:dynamin family protein [Thiobacillus sp.]MDT3708299.1 MIT C-terminal domain-containing protein [Thiobacillus sp.]
MKSPKQIRTEIQTLRADVATIRNLLVKKVQNPHEPLWGIGGDCARTADALGNVLTSQVIPDCYKVAVVGRFKAGKSSFVNELLGARLAGEDTSPETAAVTTFQHGDSVKATIRFISSESWQNLRTLHQEDPKHIDAHRVKMWESFAAKPRKNADGEIVEVFDLPGLEATYVKPGGYSMEIVLEHTGEKRSENEFRRKLKEFTSGTRPHHCLVEQIAITSPSPLLDEGVLLIDTPGLGDTERFRVTLTEKAVEDVDAVLFLTKSGASYDIHEKEFLLSLLRKGTVKQLIFVITQVDHTYDQHLANAEANDEDPETITARIKREERRIRAEINATLDELSADDSPAMRRYREQLGVVGLAFTSAKKHRDWKDGKAVQHRIHTDDPGGIERMKEQLLRLLSTESRLALVAHNIASGTQSALDELLTVIANRRAAMRDIKDGEEAERRLATFRNEFESARAKFQTTAETEVELLKTNLNEGKAKNALLIETIGLLAEKELAEFETRDVGKHWKTRRSGYWGYMHDLQGKVANRIFPRVQQLLTDMTERYATFVGHFEKHLAALSGAGADIAAKLEIADTLPFDLTKTLEGSLDKSLAAAQELIAAEEQRIISFLDDFVTDEVSDKITAARTKVSHIFGTGTTHGQSQEVRTFYAEVKQLLQDALTTHLTERSTAFGNFLAIEANSVPRNALSEVDATLASAEQDIKASAMARIGGQREAFERETDALSSELRRVVQKCAPVMGTDEEPKPSTPKPSIPERKQRRKVWTSDLPGHEWIDAVQNEAKSTIDRYNLREGDSGWSFERIFAAEHLTGCSRVALIDPYLSQPHQVRNLKEFLLAVADAAKPKEILVLTSGTWLEGNGANIRAMEEVGNDLFRSYGMSLNIEVDPTIHDRYVVCDHGVLFKLGRGLDVYKPATGLASHRPASRRVRKTEIDVFSISDSEPIHSKA